MKTGYAISALSFTNAILKIGTAFVVFIFTALMTMFAGPSQMAGVEITLKVVFIGAAYEVLTAIYNLFLAIYFLTPWSRTHRASLSAFIVGADFFFAAIVAVIALLGGALLVLAAGDTSALTMVFLPVAALCSRAVNTYGQWTALKKLNRILAP